MRDPVTTISVSAASGAAAATGVCCAIAGKVVKAVATATNRCGHTSPVLGAAAAPIFVDRNLIIAFSP